MYVSYFVAFVGEKKMSSFFFFDGTALRLNFSCTTPSQPQGAPLCRFPDMIVSSARAFIRIADLSVTVKTGDISGLSPGLTSGHPNVRCIGLFQQNPVNRGMVKNKTKL